MSALTYRQLDRAAVLWRSGRDTAEIAAILGVHESVVANSIELIRRVAKGQAA